MKVVLTGASSFIGRAVYRRLKEYGIDVIGFRHSFEESPDRLSGQKIDAWIHFAWGGAGSRGRSDPRIQEKNVSMSLSAVAKAREIGCSRFLFAGSQAEYGHAQDGGLKEEYGDTAPVSEYGRAKREVLLRTLGEGRDPGISGIARDNKERHAAVNFEARYAAPGGMRYIHMRLFSVYGPGDHGTSLISALIRGLRAGERVELGNCSQLWNYLYVDDAAGAVLLLLEKGETGIYNVGSCEIRKLKDYVLAVYDIMNKNGEVVFGVREDNAEGSADLSPDVTRLKSLGFEEMTWFEDGVLKTAEAMEGGGLDGRAPE